MIIKHDNYPKNNKLDKKNNYLIIRITLITLVTIKIKKITTVIIIFIIIFQTRRRS